MKLMYFLGLVICILLSIRTAYSRPEGPVNNSPGVCNNLMPSHGRPAQPDGQTGGYTLTTDVPFNETEELFSYTAGTTYNVNVESTTNQIAGFLVQAMDPSGGRIGVFTPSAGAGQRLVDCSTQSQPAGSSIGHSTSVRQTTESFNWTAPSGGDGFVDFRYTVVQETTIFYVALSAAAALLAPNDTATMMPPTTNTGPPVGGLPAGVTMPVRGTDNYRITARSPDGCTASDCDIFVGIDTNAGNSAVLDVYIEGNAEAWVAVGFSQTASMFDADVLGCNMNPTTNMVEVLDTWNPSSGRSNLGDLISDVGVYSTASQNGRISCSFGRTIAGSDVPNEDLRLDQPHFIIFGVGPSTPNTVSLSIHQTGVGNPMISTTMINPSTATMSIGADPSLIIRSNLTRAHGILMIIAWPLLAVIAIFFAAWMRPALPNGEWFQVHRAFMIGSLFVGIIGFMLIFVAQYRSPNPGLIDLGTSGVASINTAHFAIGILVMILQIANPIIALFRCHPGKPNRWIFNLLHGTVIGLGAEVLALTNVAIGISLFSRNFSRFQDLTVFYVYLGWMVFFFAVIGILFLLFTVLAFTSDEEGRNKLAPSLIKPLIGDGGGKQGGGGGGGGGVELAVPGQKPAGGPDADKPKVPSRDAPLRWTVLGLFAAVTTIMMLILIILIAI